MSYNRHYARTGTDRARELRREMTKQERHLWYDFLREYPVRFYRQRPVDRYILDFYCPAAKLAVELDGGQHFESEGQAHDETRTQYLNALGIEVLRFTNTQIQKEFEAVCTVIDLAVKRRKPD